MRRVPKLVLSALVALSVALGVAPATALADSNTNCPGGDSCAHVAAIGKTHYDTLAEAVTAAQDGDTVDLLRTTEGSGVKVDGTSGRTLTIDLHDFTYTVIDPTVGSPNTETNAFQLLKGSTITFKDGTIRPGTDAAKILFQNYCNLTLDNVTVDCAGSQCQYVSSNNCGNVVIKDSTLIAAEGQAAFDVYFWPTGGYSEGVSVTVEGNSVITGRVEYGSDGTADGKQDIAEKASLNIKGGTFTGSLKTSNLGVDNVASINITGGTFQAADSSTWKSYIQPGMKLDDNGEIVVDTENAVAKIGSVGYDSLAAAINAATAGDTIELINDFELTEKITTDKDVTINGNGHTITGQNIDSSVYFEITGGTFNISNTILTDFGGNVGVGTGIAVFKVTGDSAKFIGDGLTVKNFNRAGFDFVAGTFELSNSSIDCANAYGQVEGNSILTKGVKAGYGSSPVTGTLTNVDISYSKSNYDEWGAGAVEIYNNADVTINGGKITNSAYGVWVDNYYGIDNATASATLNDVYIDAESDAVMIYGHNATSATGSGNTAIVKVNGGTINGAVSIYYGDNSESATVIGATIDGMINLEGVAAMAIIDSNVTTTADPAIPNGVNVVNSYVNGTLTNIGVGENVALYNGTYYSTIESALTTADGKGGTVYLVANANLTSTIPANTTLEVRSGVTLTIENNNLGNLAQSAGTIQVNAGGALKLPNTSGELEAFIGDENARLNLTKGSVTLAVTTSGAVVTLKDGSEANIPADKELVLTFNAGTSNPMNAVIETGAKLTVNKKLTVANGSALTVDGTLNVASGGILRVNSDATLGGSGTVSNSGIVTLHHSESNDTTVSIPIILASGGAVYSQFDAGDIDIKNSLEATGSFEVNGVANSTETDPIEFGYKYSYYVAPTPAPEYSVIVAKAENGEVVVDKATAEAGETVTVTATPAEGYEVASVEVTCGDEKVDVTEEGDGTYAFVMPAADVTVAVAFQAAAPAVDLPFTDVAEGDWYYGAVSFVYASRLMTGYEGTTLFGPEDDLGREQAAMVLFRALAGASQAPAPECGLADVDQAGWYARAVNWAVASGLVTGYDDGSGLFGVGDALTRDQFAAIIARVAKADLSKADPSALDGFSDGDEVAEWAVPAVSWAAQVGILEGSDDGEGGMELRSSAEITRGEMATMIQRAAEAGLLPTA